MDIENLLYVVLAVVYILSKVMKARKKKQETGEEDVPQSTGRKPQVSFEDLLKEFGGGNQADEIDEVPELITKPKLDVSQGHLSDDEKRLIFQKSIDEAAINTSNVERTKELTFKGFETYQGASDDGFEFSDELREMLKEGDGGKKAIVLGEILNRKY